MLMLLTDIILRFRLVYQPIPCIVSLISCGGSLRSVASLTHPAVILGVLPTHFYINAAKLKLQPMEVRKRKRCSVADSSLTSELVLTGLDFYFPVHWTLFFPGTCRYNMCGIQEHARTFLFSYLSYIKACRKYLVST